MTPVFTHTHLIGNHLMHVLTLQLVLLTIIKAVERNIILKVYDGSWSRNEILLLFTLSDARQDACRLHACLQRCSQLSKMHKTLSPEAPWVFP